MTSDRHYQTRIGDLISSDSATYEVLDLLGQGTFGEVAHCWKIATNEMVAIKILKSKESIQDAKDEEFILKTIKELCSDNFNIVRWNESFIHDGHYCLEFEKLDIPLSEFLRRKQSLTLAEIRPLVQQLAVALGFLDFADIVHADLKPQNIMMVDHINQPLRLKVIDFGLACNDPSAWRGSTLQTLWYRSPEIMLGAPFGTAIDIWSLGCITAELLLGKVLFRGNDVFDTLRHIHFTIGKPTDDLLMSGLFSRQYYHPKQEDSQIIWKLKKLRKDWLHPRTVSNLSELGKTPPGLSEENARADQTDRASFIDLLTKMLEIDVHKRITSLEILQHPFIKMSHLPDTVDNSPYLKVSKDLMAICPQAKVRGAGIYSPLSPDEPQSSSAGEQPILLNTQSAGDSSPARKRKRADDDDPGCGSNSHPKTSLTKRRRRSGDSADTALPKPDQQPRASESKKRHRDEADPCATSEGSSPAKKFKLHLNVELANSLKKLFSSAEGQPDSNYESPHKKRKRDNEEALGSVRGTPPEKRRRSVNAEGGEGPAN